MEKNGNYNLKIIGAGLSRTGTKSLKEAIEILYPGEKCYHSNQVFEKQEHSNFWLEVFEGKRKDLNYVLKDFNFALDAPSCFYWKELAKENPEAKIILTVRDSPEVWFESFTALREFNNPFLSFMLPVYGSFTKYCKVMSEKTIDMFSANKAECIEKYQKHNEGVIEACEKEFKGRLLVFNVKDGWEKLCKFLNKNEPKIPFPKLNDKAEITKIVTTQKVVAAIYLFVYIVLCIVFYILYKLLVYY